MTEKYIRKPNVSCSVCRNKIYRRPHQLELTNGKAYCSMKCYGLSCRKEIPCIVCGKLIQSGLNKKTCSRGCSNTKRAGIRYNTNSPHNKFKSYKALKLRMIKIRGPYCWRCKYDKVEILQVHHKNRDRLNNNIDNLELICPNCHFEEHYQEKSWLKKYINKNGGIG